MPIRNLTSSGGSATVLNRKKRYSFAFKCSSAFKISPFLVLCTKPKSLPMIHTCFPAAVPEEFTFLKLSAIQKHFIIDAQNWQVFDGVLGGVLMQVYIKYYLGQMMRNGSFLLFVVLTDKPKCPENNCFLADAHSNRRVFQTPFF